MFHGNNQLNTVIYKASNEYKVSWKATNSVLANELLFTGDIKDSSLCKGKLLDIGCGEKPYLDVFSSHIASYTGIDIPHSLHKKMPLISLLMYTAYHSEKIPSIQFFVSKY